MVEHLREAIGYPDCDGSLIMRELKPMWVKLEESGLLLDGMNFRVFLRARTRAIYDERDTKRIWHIGAPRGVEPPTAEAELHGSIRCSTSELRGNFSIRSKDHECTTTN